MTNRVPRRGETLSHEVRGSGETVLYDEIGHQLLVLNESGAAIWLLVDGRRSVGEIADIVVETADTQRSQVVVELDAFLKDLAAKGLMTWQ